MVRYKPLCFINPQNSFLFIIARKIPASFSVTVGEHDMVQRSIISCSARSGGSSGYRAKWIELFLVLLSVSCNMNNKLWV